MNVVITGANRGLGFGFVQHYLSQGCGVWGCYRSGPDQLEGVSSSRLHTLQWDVTEEKPARFADEAGFPERIDLLINNAGVYGPKDGAGQALSTVTPETMLSVYDVNCVGPLRVVQALLPRIMAARGTIANLSSKMGSSADNGSGGCYAYRAAKAALVIVSKSMAVDLAPDGVRVITLHPGWVRTAMTSHSGLIDIDESVAGMSDVIQKIDHYELGAFVAYNGQVVPF